MTEVERQALQDRIGLTCGAVAALMALIYMASRLGLPDQAEAAATVAKALGLGLAVCTCPALLAPWLRRVGDVPAVTAVPVLFILLMILSWIPGGWVVATILGGAGLARSLPSCRTPSLATVAWAVLATVLIGVLAIYALPRSNPPFSVEQAWNRTLFIDGFFNLATAQMLRWFDVPAAGFNGLVWGKYHFGLNLLTARLAMLVDADIPHFFPALMHVTVLPALIRVLAGAAVRLVGRDTALPLVVLVIGLIILHASATNDTLFISPSYMISIMAVAALFPLIVWVADHPDRLGGKEAPLWAWLGLAVLLYVTWSLKVTSGLMLTIGLGWLVLRSRRGWGAIALAGLFVGMVSVLAMVSFATTGNHGSQMSLSFFSYYWADEVKVWHRPFFPLIYSALPLAAIVAILAEAGALTRKGWVGAISARRLVEAEALALLVVAGYLPGLFLYTADLVWIYCYDLPTWLGLSMVAGRLIQDRMSAPRPAGLSVAVLIALVLLIPTWEMVGKTLMKRSGRFAAEIIDTHLGLQGGALPERRDLTARGEAVFSALSDRAALARLVLSPKPQPEWASRVQAVVSQARLEGGARTALYIPPSNREFWDDVIDCRMTAMYVPAMTGMPMIDGRAPLPCVPVYGYGFELMDKPGHDHPLDDGAVCAKAAASRLGPVLRVESLTDPSRNRMLACR